MSTNIQTEAEKSENEEKNYVLDSKRKFASKIMARAVGRLSALGGMLEPFLAKKHNNAEIKKL